MGCGLVCGPLIVSTNSRTTGKLTYFLSNGKKIDVINKQLIHGQIGAIGIGLAITFLGHQIAGLLPMVGSTTLCMLLGILSGFFISSTKLKSSLSIIEKQSLSAALILLGFEMHFDEVPVALVLLFFSIIASAIFFVRFALLDPVKREFGYLLAVGHTVCGSSAIMAVSRLLPAQKEFVAISVVLINVMSVLGSFILAFILLTTNLQDSQIAYLIGGSVQAVGHVAVASGFFGSEVITQAMIIKLVRVSLLVPILILGSVTIQKEDSQTGFSSLIRSIPTYLVGFIVTCILAHTGWLSSYHENFSKLSHILLSLSLACLGISVNFREVMKLSGFALNLSFGILVLQWFGLGLGLYWLGL